MLASAMLVISVGLVCLPAFSALALTVADFGGREIGGDVKDLSSKKKSCFLLFPVIVLLAHTTRSLASAAHLNVVAGVT